MYDVISIGSSLVDIFIRSSLFSLQSTDKGVMLCQRYGQKLEIDDFQVLTGGGGSNTAVGFARQGFRTGVVSELGRDVFAQLILDEFHAEKVLTNLVIQEKKEQTGGAVILVDGRGGRTVMVHRGAASMLDPTDIPTGSVRRAGWVHLSSISGRLSTLEKLFQLRQESKRMSWNPGTRELELLRTHQIGLQPWPVEILTLNREEWLALGPVAKLILHQTPVVIITNGGQVGAVLTKNKSYNFAPPPTSSVDDTGAGDAFVVGFVSQYLRQPEVEPAVQAAVANAQSVIAYFGAKKGLMVRY